MNDISITRNGIIWGYIAQFFSIASGLITLPLILKLLSAEEIGMNYLMLTIGSLVALFDFGFAPQFGRNITYVFSGAQELKREGVDISSGNINYRLLATMIAVAKSMYRILAAIVLVIMLSGGTLYIYKVTAGFTNIKDSLLIWVIYSFSVFFSVYYTYYSSLLTGRGLIIESKKAMLASRIFGITLTIILLLTGWGLLGVAIANLIAPFVSRFLSYRYFFSSELRDKLSQYQITKKEKIDLFSIIWYNAKKLGIVFIGSYAINRLSLFLAGLYCSLDEVASYGLMIQLVSVLSVISGTLFSVSEPHFAALCVKGDRVKLLRSFASTMIVYYCLFIGGAVLLISVAPFLLNFIKANAELPCLGTLILYSVVILLENNHSNFSTFIVINNRIPFVKPSLYAGFAIALGSFLSLQYTTLGILGLVIVQGGCQLAYANWKWPNVVCREFDISFISFLLIGLKESIERIKVYVRL